MYKFRSERFRAQFDGVLERKGAAQAAALLEENCDALLSRGRPETFAECASAIPPRLQAFYPRTMLALAWRLIAQWHFSQVDDLLAAIRLRLVELDRSGTDAAEVSHLRHELKHREMMLSLTQDDMPHAERLCRELIEQRYRTDSYVNGSLFTSLLHARREQFKLTDVDLLDTQATDYHSSVDNPSALVVHNSLTALSLFALGRAGEAVDRLTETLAIASRIEPGTDVPMVATAALPLAEILYERGAFEEAEALVSQHLTHAHRTGVVDQLISGYLTRARLHRRAGEHRQALEILDRAELFAAKRGFRRLSAWAEAERLGILLQQGRLGMERELGRSLRGASVERHMPGISTTTVDEAHALAWAHLAEAHCRLDDGYRLATAWSRRLRREGATRARIRWNLVAVRFLVLAGERRKAARLLRETLGVAAKGEFVASFLDEPVIMDLLASERQENADTLDPDADAFAVRILGADRSTRDRAREAEESGPASMGSLSPREIDVLTLASNAWGNRDIADRLGLTEGTVKWYLQQIYDKLGVRKRALAVDKARRFGIIGSPG
jgi:LuxR family maltose regulon positive regulatory protein